MFRPIWSSLGVKIFWRGNCCLLLLLMLLNIYRSSQCAYVFELVGCFLVVFFAAYLVLEWSVKFGLDIRFIDHLQIVTTSNCNSLTELHTLNITITIATDFITVIITVSRSCYKYHCNYSTLKVFSFNWALNLLLQTVPVITSRHGTNRKHCSYCCSVVAY
jgi:hypothetical protein